MKNEVHAYASVCVHVLIVEMTSEGMEEIKFYVSGLRN